MLGKILIVNKKDGSVLGWFGEGERPDFIDIQLIELEPNQYDELFIKMNKIEDLKVTDIDNKILICNPSSKPLTLEQQITELQQQLLQAQGVI